MKIGVFKTYELFCAMKLHWNTKHYNFVECKGKTKLTRVSLDTSSEKSFYYHLNEKYKTSEELIGYLIPCFLENPKVNVRDLCNERYKNAAEKWLNKIKSLKSVFKDDVFHIALFIKQNKIDSDYFFCSDMIYKALINDSIQLETFIILNFILKFLDKHAVDDIIYKYEYELKVNKYKAFISVNLDAYKKILINSIAEAKEENYVISKISM